MFHAILKRKCNTERRLMKDVNFERKSQESFEIRHICLLRRSKNLADGVSDTDHYGALDKLKYAQVDKTEVIEKIDRMQSDAPTPSSNFGSVCTWRTRTTYFFRAHLWSFIASLSADIAGSRNTEQADRWYWLTEY